MKASFAVIDLAPEANSQDVGGCIGDDALAIQTLPVPKNTAAIDGRQPSFQVTWAGSPDDIAEAQRLRFRVFVRELGARLSLPHDAPAEHDIDPFDAFCDHLLIRAHGGPQHGEVVATCRVLDPEGACKAGGLYADKEFDLAPLRVVCLRIANNLSSKLVLRQADCRHRIQVEVLSKAGFDVLEARGA